MYRNHPHLGRLETIMSRVRAYWSTLQCHNVPDMNLHQQLMEEIAEEGAAIDGEDLKQTGRKRPLPTSSSSSTH